MLLPEPLELEPTGGESPPGRLAVVGDLPPAVADRLVRGWLESDAAVGSTTVVFEVGPDAPRPLQMGADETYELIVDGGDVQVRAATDVGARRAVETLLQWAHGGALPHGTLRDAPRYPWRGLLLDVCRHWIGPERILETIDAMAAAKLNVLHLHLSEDQAFRLESRRRPLLHELGSDGRFLGVDDVRRIVDHAADAGVRVVPEIDLPGHATSWLVAYPHLAATPGPFELRRSAGIATVALDPTNPEVYEVVGDVLADVAELFPDRYLHIGGDEVDARSWPGLDAVADQRSFTARVAAIVRGLGKVPIVWDEAWHPDLDPDVVVQVWRGHRRLRAAAAEGRPVLFSSAYYLDLGYDPVHHRVDPSVDADGWAASRARLHADPRLLTWAPLVEGMDVAFDGTDPAPDEVDPSSLLGGEAAMWAELVTEDVLALRLWPAAAAVAEVLWSGVPDADSDLPERLADFVDVLATTTSTDVDAVRGRLCLELAGGDPSLAAAIEVLSGCCEPSKWYSRHASLPGGSLEVPLDRIVDALPSSSGVLGPISPEDLVGWRAAAERILAVDRPSERVAELQLLAARLRDVCDGVSVDRLVPRDPTDVVLLPELGVVGRR